MLVDGDDDNEMTAARYKLQRNVNTASRFIRQSFTEVMERTSKPDSKAVAYLESLTAGLQSLRLASRLKPCLGQLMG